MRVLLVEDEPLWQNAVRQLVGMQPGWQVVAVACHYQEAMNYYDELLPDVVLLDWNIIGDKDGADVGTALIEEKGHQPELMAMVSGADTSMLPDTLYIKISKSRMASDLIPALEGMAVYLAKGA